MKHLLLTTAKLSLALFIGLMFSTNIASAQCTATGDQAIYGINNTWIGYVYQGNSFNTYKGYVNQGTSTNPNFDQAFGGAQASYATSSCTAYTDTFSVRYRLTKTFTVNTYTFTVGGDDGYRLSLDGGSTWNINNWGDHGYATSTYTVTLDGTYDLVLEYYENQGDNRVSFNVTNPCVATGDPSVYGTNNTWIGYVYSGMNFDTYKGYVNEGSPSSLNFDQSFGGNNVNYATSGCPVNTNQFSVRYRLQQNLPLGTYTFTVGGDDGYRLSLDGGSTWSIDRWVDQSYTVNTYTVTTSGVKNIVLEFYENGGDNRININMAFAPAAILPIKLLTWSAVAAEDKAQLQWKTASAENFSHFMVQRSMDGASFQDVKTIIYEDGSTQSVRNFSFKDSYSISSSVFYRLAMVDKDGKTEFSSIIRLSSGSKVSETKMYPTVVENGSIFIESGKQIDNANMEIYSMAGVKLGATKLSLINGRQQVSLGNGFAGVASGSYVVLLSDSHSIITKKVIFVK